MLSIHLELMLCFILFNFLLPKTLSRATLPPPKIHQVRSTDDLTDSGVAELGTSDFQCVDILQNPQWASISGPINVPACLWALSQVQQSAGPDTESQRIFYSSASYPGGPPRKLAIRLPKGRVTRKCFLKFLFSIFRSTTSSTFNIEPYLHSLTSHRPKIVALLRGNCVFVIRMTRDFGSTSLPLVDGGFLPTRGTSLASATWKEIFDAAQKILDVCVRKSGGSSPGWSAVGRGGTTEGQIVVGFLLRSSVIESLYGPSSRAMQNPAGNAISGFQPDDGIIIIS